MASGRQPKLLIGNSFPLSLIVRRIVVEPRPIEELRVKMEGAIVVSFWGHPSTLASASAAVGRDLSPSSGRPALLLDANGLPSLEGESFEECWVVSPEFAPGFRPAPGVEVMPEKILGWRVLRLAWLEALQIATPDP